MKLIKYCIIGGMPSQRMEKGKRKRESLHYKRWMREAIEQLKELGVPSTPIKKVFKLKIDICHSIWIEQSDHIQGDMIMDAMIEAGIIEGKSFYHIRNMEFTPMFEYQNGHCIIKMFIEEDHKKNEGISYEKITLCEDLETTKLYENGHHFI